MGIQYHKVASSLPAAVPDGTLLDHVLVDQYNRPIGASVPVDSTGTPLGTLANPLRNQQVGISTAQIVDALGNGVTVTNNKLDVNANAILAGSVALTSSTAEIGNVKNSGTFAVQAASAIAEGADITQGSKADAPATTATTDSWSIVAVLKGVLKVLLAVWDSGTHLLVTFSNSTIGISAGTAEIGNVKNSGTFAVQSTSTIADNAHVTFGAKADNRNAATDTTAITAMAVLKQISYMLQNLVLSAGSAVIGKFGIDQTTPGTTNAVQIIPGVSGGWTPYHLISAASTNATNVKNSAGQVGPIAVGNVNASPRYLKLYDKASAPTVGSDTPVWTMIIPGNTAGAGSNISVVCGMVFANGISYALTAGMADNDTGAVGVADICLNLGYK